MPVFREQNPQVPLSARGGPPYAGYRRPPPFPRPRELFGIQTSAYPAQGYYTTGYPEADQYLRLPDYLLPDPALPTIEPTGIDWTSLASVLLLAWGVHRFWLREERAR